MDSGGTPLTDADCRSLWSRCLSSARERLEPSTYHSWLAPAVFDRLDGDRFVVVFPNEFTAKFARAHFRIMLEELLREYADLENISLVCTASRETPDAGSATSGGAPRASRQPYMYLRPGYTFENFVQGPSNELAYAGALSVAREEGISRYNPLFIYGGVGLGKTHLMQAIAHYVRDNQPSRTFCYVSSEEFLRQFIQAIERSSMSDFHNRYRDIDFLLMDDVQFLAGKEGTQEELFHRFNDLYQYGKQIVLTSDRPPHEIEPLEERLVSRFQSGLVADIQPPQYETRLAILKMKVRDEGQVIPLEVLDFIASSIRNNVRQLEGIVHLLAATSRVQGRSIDMDLAKKVINDFLGTQYRKLSPSTITAAVAEYFSMPPARLRGKLRKREILVPRQVSMYLIRELTDTSLSEIGAFFDGRDHSTVLNSIERINLLCEEDASLKRKVAEIRKKLTE
jgi:chromosomal replication initiator protein